ncbi:hypothetical protein [Mangrovibacterium sp.]|uniref:hypothetical protein n=1 Tax=Mangrovibacterium sp. TaxID=1961364 RepID=UPI0035682491
MNILLVYPQCPDSFWSFKNALKFINKKAAVPPLGLITVSAMLPSSWHKRLVDMNVSALHASDIQWADYVFISAMYIQKQSVRKVMDECGKWHTKIVAGGPLFTQEHDNYPQVDHFILNEAEITLPPFLTDLEMGQPKRLYQTSEYADITQTPVPDVHTCPNDKSSGAAGLVMAIVGGALMSPIQGAIIDLNQVTWLPALNFSFVLLLISFFVIAFFDYRCTEQSYN